MSRRLVAAAVVVGIAVVSAQAPETRIVSVTSGRLRSAPAADATVVAVLPFGAELTALEEQAGVARWLRARDAKGREGWIRADLTQPVRPDTRQAVSEQLVAARLDQVRDGFAERVEVLEFVDRLVGEAGDAAVRARLSRLRLKALRRVLDALSPDKAAEDPYRGWLARHDASVVYSEPGGVWMISPEEFDRAHAQARGTPSADEIAWLAASEGLAGECEGYVPCHVSSANALEGEYLRRHPHGTHVAEAVERLAELLIGITAGLKGPAAESPYVLERQDCAELRKSLTPLRAAVAATKAGRRAEVLSALDALARRCP